jgi:hypothetical protein
MPLSSASGLSLADPGEDAPLHIRTGRKHAADLTAADQIEAGAEVREVTQKGDVGVRLHRVADLDIQALKALRQAPIIIGHCPSTIDVGRCPVELRDRAEINRFTVQTGPNVAEVVHRLEKRRERTPR